MDERLDCRVTAAVLRSGSSIALSGHAAALFCAVMRPGAWGPFVAWCALAYFALRVEIDARLFGLLAESSPESLDTGSLDQWLAAAGLRKNARPKRLEDRRRGAMRLWQALLMALVVEIVLVAGALLWSRR